MAEQPTPEATPNLRDETAEQLADWSKALRERCEAARKAALDASDTARQLIEDAKYTRKSR